MTLTPLLLAALLGCVSADLALPRGVPPSRASLYAAADTFTCLDGTDTIGFHLINDDYCDCEDGSDEPGTAACAAGQFYCPNLGHAAAQVPSAWVNDGVCDCCDGSDEYTSGACSNTCDELGAEARVRQERLSEMRLRGYEVKMKLMEAGQEKLAEKQTRLTELAREKEVAVGVKEQRQSVKEAAEEQEKLLLDAWQEARRQEQEQQEAQERAEAEELFTRLDTNSDGRLQREELQQEATLDKNGDGAVSLDEVDSITMNKPELEQEEFLTSTWHLLKPLLHPSEATADPLPAPPTEELAQPEETEEEPEEFLGEDAYEPAEDGDEDSEDSDLEDEELDPERYHRERHVGSATPLNPPPAEPEYDSETQAAVDAAKAARGELDEADRRVRELEREVEEVESFTGADLGHEQAFAGLHHECFILETREYEYKLCMFDKASQKPRSGGVETSLGKWGRWESPQETAYTQQLYENGQQCWNGPKRSVHVTLTCGEETRILDVTEPAKCEYRFSMETPAVCEKPSADSEQLYHDEL